jgi:hypothetical protein
MLIFPKILRPGQLYRPHVGTTDQSPSVVPAQGRYTDIDSLSSFSQGVGTTDQSPSVVPAQGRYTDIDSLSSFSQGVGTTDPVSVLPAP